MAALHIIPLNGTQIPPKVLALIRERAFKMEVGQIATHGFASDGCDVYMRTMGGAIQAIVRGGSMPYMLTIKMEASSSYSFYSQNGGATYESMTQPDFRVRFVSPVATEWQEFDTIANDQTVYDSILTDSGLVPFDPGIDGYAYVCRAVPNGNYKSSDTRLKARWSATGPGIISIDGRLAVRYEAMVERSYSEGRQESEKCLYTYLGNPLEQNGEEVYREAATRHLDDSGEPSLENGPSNWTIFIGWASNQVQSFASRDVTGTDAALLTAQLGAFQNLANKKLRLEICARAITQASGGATPTTSSGKITAEVFRPPQQNPTSFFLHNGTDFSIPTSERPVKDDAKTRQLEMALLSVPPEYYDSPQVTAVFEYDFSTNEMSLSSV